MVRFKVAKVVLTGAVAVAAWAGTAGTARAQFVKGGPEGSVGFANGDGTYTYIYPSRINGGWPKPGGPTMWTPFGPSWVNKDGSVGGNFTDPFTGDTQLRKRPATLPRAGGPVSTGAARAGVAVAGPPRAGTAFRQGPPRR